MTTQQDDEWIEIIRVFQSIATPIDGPAGANEMKRLEALGITFDEAFAMAEKMVIDPLMN